MITGVFDFINAAKERPAGKLLIAKGNEHGIQGKRPDRLAQVDPLAAILQRNETCEMVVAPTRVLELPV